jgi:hypothetical protein
MVRSVAKLSSPPPTQRRKESKMETELTTIALMILFVANAIIIHNHIDDVEARLTALIKDAKEGK